MVTRVRQTAAALLLCGSSVMAFAQTATVKVSVTVMQPLPCTINGGRPIEVDFGDEVMTTRINGNFYRMPIDFSFTCNNPYKTPCGCRCRAAPPISAGLLGTSRDGLAILILQRQGGDQLPLNSAQFFLSQSG